MRLRLTFLSIFLFVIQSAKIPSHLSQESLSDTVVFQYPELLVEYFPMGDWSKDTEELYAYALGIFLVYSDSNLFSASFDHIIQEKFTFDFNFTNFLSLLDSNNLMMTSSFSPLLVDKRTKLAGFFHRVLDVEKLRMVYKERQKRIEADFDTSLEGYALKVSLRDAHEMIARGAKSPLAVAAIDIAILRIINLASHNEEYLHYIGFNIDGSLVAALLALRTLPAIGTNVSKDIAGLFSLLPKFRPAEYEDVAKHLIGLIALLPPGCMLKECCQSIVSKSSIRNSTALNLLSHPLVEFTFLTFHERIEEYCRVRDSGFLRILINGCRGNVHVNLNFQQIHLSRVTFYKGKIKKQRVLFEKGIMASFASFIFAESAESDGDNVLVAAIIPLDDRSLQMFGRYVLGEISEMNEIAYLQAAYGVFLVTSPMPITTMDSINLLYY